MQYTNAVRKLACGMLMLAIIPCGRIVKAASDGGEGEYRVHFTLPTEPFVKLGDSILYTTETDCRLPGGDWTPSPPSTITVLDPNGVQYQGEDSVTVTTTKTGDYTATASCNADPETTDDAITVTVLHTDIVQTDEEACIHGNASTLTLSAGDAGHVDSFDGGGGWTWIVNPAEGLDCSDDGYKTFTYTPAQSEPGSYAITAAADLLARCHDECSVTVVKVDLDVEGVADEDEADAPGALVCVTNGTAGAATRKQITVNKCAPASWDGQVTLLWSAGNVRVYTAPSNGVEVTSGTTFANTALPTNLWVEGIAVSDTAGDVVFRLNPRNVDCPHTATGCDRMVMTAIRVDLDGDNEEDGDVDADDDAAEEDLPVIVAINEDTRELTVLEVGVSSGGTLKIKKSGDGKITLKKADGATVLGESDSESISILSDAGSSDLVLTLDGTEVGDIDLELEFVSGAFSCSDPFKVKVVKSDIVLRTGSTSLAALIGEDFTHSGIDWEQNVTDLFDPGIERISLSTFESYASDKTTKQRLRLKKNLFMGRRVWAKVYDNMEASSYSIPTGAKPWNLFTTSADYSTANCNEFAHEQFQKAVADVYGELTKTAHQTSYIAAYYTGSAVSELAETKHVTSHAGKVPCAGPFMLAMVGYLEYRSKQVGATTLFENVYEGEILDFWYNPWTSSRYDSGMSSCSVCGTYPSVPWYSWPFVELWDEAHHNTITPSGFSGSTYFETITY